MPGTKGKIPSSPSVRLDPLLIRRAAYGGDCAGGTSAPSSASRARQRDSRLVEGTEHLPDGACSWVMVSSVATASKIGIES